MIFKPLYQLFNAFTRKQKFALFRLQFLIIFMAISEVVGISLVGPFLSIVSDTEILQEEGFLRSLYLFVGIQDINSFIFFVGGFVLIMLLLSTIISTFTLRAAVHFAQKLGAEISASLYDFYMRQNWLYHNSVNSSRLMNNVVSESNRVTASVLYPLMILNARLIVGIAIISLLLSIDYKVTIFGALIFGGIYILIYRLVQIRLNHNGELISKSMQIRFRLLNEGFDGIKDTLILGRSMLFRERFYQSSMDLGRSYGSNTTLNEVPKYWVEFLAFGAMISLIMLLLDTNDGKLAAILPTLGIFAMASYKLLPVFQTIYGNFTYIKAAIPALNSIKSDLTSWKEITEGAEEKFNYERLNFETLTLKNISFKYPNKHSKSINNLSLQIKKNQVIGLVGKSGSGKSTLADIILGLLEPDSGLIEINNERLIERNKRAWQNNFGYVSQNIFLSDSSIYENIAFGIPRENISLDDVNRSIKLANLSELIETLPDGIETVIGEKGLQLSGGQRQRIAIARSLYNDPDILIFDEATSALDGVNEKAIMESINLLANKKTIILIAHRLNTIKECDQIYLLDGGELIDSGTFDELKQKNKSFYEMSKNA